jgi:hypothetical protein
MFDNLRKKVVQMSLNSSTICKSLVSSRMFSSVIMGQISMIKNPRASRGYNFLVLHLHTSPWTSSPLTLNKSWKSKLILIKKQNLTIHAKGKMLG